MGYVYVLLFTFFTFFLVHAVLPMRYRHKDLEGFHYKTKE